jgi:hypothetical protein
VYLFSCQERIPVVQATFSRFRRLLQSFRDDFFASGNHSRFSTNYSNVSGTNFLFQGTTPAFQASVFDNRLGFSLLGEKPSPNRLRKNPDWVVVGALYERPFFFESLKWGRS